MYTVDMLTTVAIHELGHTFGLVDYEEDRLEDYSIMYWQMNEDSLTGTYILSKNTLDKSDADQLLFSCQIINSIKKKEISGKDVFAQIIPKGSSIVIPNEITGSSSFGSENGKMVKSE